MSIGTFTCEVCGVDFDYSEGGLCAACGRVLCLRHLPPDKHETPADSALTQPTDHSDLPRQGWGERFRTWPVRLLLRLRADLQKHERDRR